MTMLRSTLSTLSLLLISLLSLVASCRTTREGGQGSDEGAQTAESSVLSYLGDYPEVELPPNTYRLTLPHVSPLEDFRVELLPALANTDPTHTSIDGRFVTGEPLGESVPPWTQMSVGSSPGIEGFPVATNGLSRFRR